MTNRFWALVAIASTASATVGWGANLTVDTTGWTGDGTSKDEVGGGGEWRWKNLGAPFADGAARFVDGASITSPTFATQLIHEVEVTLRCSTNAPNRFLQLTFLRDGKVVSGPLAFWPVFRADKAEGQSLAVGTDRRANAVKLSLSEGDLGDWGIYSFALSTMPNDNPPQPSDGENGFTISIQ